MRKYTEGGLDDFFYTDGQQKIHFFDRERPAMISAVNFQPSQIVCLEHEGTRLYAEVIQIVESRQMCWVRPLILAISLSGDDVESEPPVLYDLRQGADLLWPEILFRSALDTEVIPLLTHLMASKSQTESTQVASQQFQGFVRQVWQAYQSNFRF